MAMIQPYNPKVSPKAGASSGGAGREGEEETDEEGGRQQY